MIALAKAHELAHRIHFDGMVILLVSGWLADCQSCWFKL
jgi:hypothetical protein